METLFLASIIEHNVEAARHGDDELVEILVGVPAPLGTTRNIVEVIGTLDIERYVIPAFDEGEIATRIGDLGKIDHPTSIETEWFHR